MDDFHMDNWRPSVESSTFGGGLPSTTQMMAQMERRMAKMREEMNSMSLFGGREGRSLLSGDDMGTGFPSLSSDGMLSKGSGGGTGSNIMSSSTSRSSRFSSSTVANVPVY
ncbi:unnamed protein product [Protopolystoma xenopodis]|uniref:Uncharacterized protein n=1 Tax=Protopolystoma xenopodis TaxID=117903 RepID=A0A3S5C396_9PLAT|nr:unnamed protein product [Protopolystoma xenopodis]